MSRAPHTSAATPLVQWHIQPMRNPFEAPRPTVEHQPYLSLGDPTVRRRSPEQMREVMDRRVHRWFAQSFDALPPDASRGDRIARVFGDQGWVSRAQVAQPDHRWPMHGWLLNHPQHGMIVYSDKTREGDVSPERLALSRGPWGGSSRLTWAPDLPGLLERVVVPDDFPIGLAYPRYPNGRVTRALTAHAYRQADQSHQAATAVLLALTGRNIADFLRTVDADDVSVQSA